MALTSWKAFDFFEVSQVTLPKDTSSSIFDNDVTSLITGASSLFLGSSNGTVSIVSAAFKVIRTFKAYDVGVSVTHLKQIPETSLLVSVGEDLSSEPVLKVWALDKNEKKSSDPKCLCIISVQNGRRQFPVSAFVVLDDLSQVAVGFANGAVTVIRGDLIHDRGTKQRTVFESEEPITGLEVREAASTTLYIATTGRISTLVISGKGQGQPVRTLDKQGCGVGCLTIDTDTKDVLVARDDAIYTYGPNGRGRSFAFDGPKKLITTFGDYVALLCPPRVAQVSKSKQFRRLGGDEIDDMFASTSFSLLDLDLRFIAYTNALPSQVKYVFQEWGNLFLVTDEGKLYRYQEKTLQQKLDILYQRNLYIMAINLAQKSGVDKPQQNMIFRKYGDYLYQRGDFDTAMQQYLRAIDNTEPSQVIRKFLDTQRIHNLIEYLEELHDHDKATADHTTLLLNCYAKLKDTEKLDAFIKAPGELKFDLETAISMCRQGGYFEQAAYLATKHGENDLVVDILIEDSKKYAEALEYIWRLDPAVAYSNLMKYARTLLYHCPEQTTDLFISYYTGNYRPKPVTAPTSAPTPVATTSTGAFSNLTALLPLPYMSRSAVDTPGASAEQKATVADATLTADQENGPALDYDIPKPRTAFSSFVSHPNQFVFFLEALMKNLEIQDPDRVDIYTTLFELYLEMSQQPNISSSEKDSWREKARSLLIQTDQKDEDGSLPISASNVLLISALSNYRDGTTLIRERAGLYADIFRSYTAAKDTAGAIDAVRKYGKQSPSLYVDALAYISSSPETLKEAGGEKTLLEILRKIEDQNLMAPLQVVKTLSLSNVVTMGMIRSYLSEALRRERGEIEGNKRLIDSYRTETAQKKEEIKELGTKPVVFQSRRCSSCGGGLELPVVHFLCKHSFHQRCLNANLQDGGDVKDDCPICKPGNDTIRAIRQAQVDSVDAHEIFKGAVDRASGDRFGAISEFFGRGVMNVPPSGSD
ncbi:MAG: hypothetical protein Q9227_002231 [Pyrenula ochraceoflavens]